MKYLMVALIFMSCTKQVTRIENTVDTPTRNTTYYIAENGSGLNTGLKPNQAWNLEQANSFSFQPGDTIRITGKIHGTLTLTESGTHDAMIVILGGTIFSGDKDGLVLYNNHNIRVNGLTLQGSGDFSSGAKNSGLTLLADDQKRHGNIILENITARGYAFAGIRSHLYMSPAIVWESEDAAINYPGGYDSVLVNHVTADSNGYAGIDLAGMWPGRQNKQIIITNSSASYNRGIRNMQPHSGHGIVMSDVLGGIIDSCMASYNGWEFGSGNVGIWTYSSASVMISNSVSFKNISISGIDGDGFDLDGGTWNCTMQNNLSYENDGAGYLIYEYGDPYSMKHNTCRYNISKNDARKGKQYGGISIGGAAPLYNISIYNNTIITDNGKAITKLGHEVQGTLAIKNNILSGTESPYLYKDATNNYIGDAKLDDKFIPQASSPVINKGLDIAGLPEKDFYYNQIRELRDIGAVEF